MIRFITIAFAFLLLPVIGVNRALGAPQDNPAAYTVRILVIDAPELAAARVAMLTAPQDDKALLEQMAELVASGVATVAADTIARCGTGNWKTEAQSEVPYGTEFFVDKKWRQLLPNAFTFRNAGATLEAEIVPGRDGESATLAMVWNRTRYAGRKSFPVMSVKAFTDVEQPVFLTDRVLARVAVASGQWRLAAMTRPVTLDEGPGLPRALLIFVKVWDDSRQPAAPAVSSDSRLHLFVFRVPMEEGMGMALRPNGSDGTLFESLLTRAETGEIGLAGHAACLVSRHGKVETGNDGNAASDPFASGLLNVGESKATSTHEYAYATHYRPDPGSFSYRNLGHGLTVRLDRSEDSGGGRMTVAWEASDDPVKFLPLSPQPEAASMTVPEFSTQSLGFHVLVQRGTVRLAGAVLRPDDGGPRMMDVHFLKCAGPALEVGGDSKDHTEVWAGLVSLPSSEGARLTARGAVQKWEDVDPLVKSGAARVLAWHSVGGLKGSVGAVKRHTETPVPTKAAVYPDDAGMAYGTHIHFHTLGDSVELTLPSHNGAAFDGKFSVSLEKPALPGLSVLRAAAKDGAKLPAFVRTEAVFPAGEEHGPPVKNGQPEIVRFAPCTAREGNAEHGRWHAVVLFFRED